MDTVAVEARPCQFRQMVCALRRGSHRETVSLFIFFCRLRLLVCRSHDLRHFRFALSTFATTMIPRHTPFPSACIMDYTIGVRASIRFQYKDTWFDSQRIDKRILRIERSTKRKIGRRFFLNLYGAILRLLRGILEVLNAHTRARLKTNHCRIYEVSFSLFLSIFIFLFLSAS